MAMLRVYTQNDGSVTARHIRVSRSKIERKKDFRSLKDGFSLYNRYAEKQAQAIFDGPHDWSIFEREYQSFGKIDGPYMIRKAFSSLRSLTERVS